MARDDPEIICLDSDGNESPPPDPKHREQHGITALLTSGGMIDLNRVLSPEISRTITSSHTLNSNDVVKQRQFYDNFGHPRTSSDVDLRTPPRILVKGKTKHYGNVNHVIEVEPISTSSVSITNDSEMINFKNVTISEQHIYPVVSQLCTSIPKEPTPIIPSAKIYEVSDSRLANYTFEADTPTAQANTRSKGTNTLYFRFKCTFGNCQRIIRGDVNFVFHLWAHVATCADNVDLYTPKGGRAGSRRKSYPQLKLPGVNFTSRCPECLTLFHSPVLMQIHYTKVHSQLKQAVTKYSCYICEKDLNSPNALREHLKMHNPNDAPYTCKICNFRSNVRSNVINHYVTKHRNTGTLMCPFCLWHQSVPIPYRNANTWNIQAPLVLFQKFVDHMWSHAMKKKISCNQCTTAIIDESFEQSRDLTIAQHRIHHNFDCSRRDYQIIFTKPKRGIQKSALHLTSIKCKECSKTISSLLRVNETCPECLKRTFWKQVEEQCGTKPGPNGAVYKCDCGLTTRIMDKIYYHFNLTKHNFKLHDEILNDANKEVEVLDNDENVLNVLYEDNDLEAEIFGERMSPVKQASVDVEQDRFILLSGDFDSIVQIGDRIKSLSSEEHFRRINDFQRILARGYPTDQNFSGLQDLPIVASCGQSSTLSPVSLKTAPIESDSHLHKKEERNDNIPVSIMKPMKLRKRAAGEDDDDRPPIPVKIPGRSARDDDDEPPTLEREQDVEFNELEEENDIDEVDYEEDSITAFVDDEYGDNSEENTEGNVELDEDENEWIIYSNGEQTGSRQ